MFQIMVENRPFILGTLVLVVFSALVFHILYPLVRVDSFAFYSYTFPQKISEIRFDTMYHTQKSVEGSFLSEVIGKYLICIVNSYSIGIV